MRREAPRLEVAEADYLAIEAGVVGLLSYALFPLFFPLFFPSYLWGAFYFYCAIGGRRKWVTAPRLPPDTSHAVAVCQTRSAKCFIAIAQRFCRINVEKNLRGAAFLLHNRRQCLHT